MSYGICSIEDLPDLHKPHFPAMVLVICGSSTVYTHYVSPHPDESVDLVVARHLSELVDTMGQDNVDLL